MKSIDIFPWDENFNTGLEIIDEQHKKLVQLLNILANHVAFQHDIPELDAIFNVLTDYVVYHFQTEEAIWHKYLPETHLGARHKKEHNSFISTVLKLKAEQNTKPKEGMIEELITFLARWLASHILEKDKHMAMIVLAMQSGKSQKQAEEQAKHQMSGAMKVLIEIILSTYSSLATNTLQLMKEITERKRVEQQLRIAAIVFESKEGIMVTDANKLILTVNLAFTTLTGYTAEEVIGKNPRILSSGRQDASFYAAMWDSINTNDSWEGEIWNRRKNGEFYPEYLAITAVKNQAGIVVNYVGLFSDITQSSAAAAEIKLLAFYDPLTGLPNRRLLQDRLKQALASSARGGRQGALLFMDLDNFKALNDTLGHDIGDLLLKQVAQRLETCVREGDTVARPGGDEFVVMLEDLHEQPIEAAAQTESIANKILASLQQTYQLGNIEYHCTISIGACLFSNSENTQDDPLKQADIAMYQAKKSGRNALRFFDPNMQDTINKRVALEKELHLALAESQFELYYQPQVNLNRLTIGAEILIRWRHPDRGLVTPSEFMPLVEETSLILPIGHWVLEMACIQLKAWQQAACNCELPLSVNVSAKQFRQVTFVTQVQTVVQRHGINPSLLKLELTESMLLEDIEDTIAKMNALNKIGVLFSLDDFGTGYSCLQYLKRLPLNQIKIDQSFIRDIAVDSSDRAIVRTIIAMAKSLNLDVIAEGVETEEQRQLLLNNGCINYQGYLFSKPVPIEQFEALLKKD